MLPVAAVRLAVVWKSVPVPALVMEPVALLIVGEITGAVEAGEIVTALVAPMRARQQVLGL